MVSLVAVAHLSQVVEPHGRRGFLASLPRGVAVDIVLDHRLPLEAWTEFCEIRQHLTRLRLRFLCPDPTIHSHWGRALTDFARYEAEIESGWCA